jgi:ferrous iron transport protein A
VARQTRGRAGGSAQCLESQTKIHKEVEKKMSPENMTCLSNMAPGEVGIVVDLSGGREIVSRLAVLGLTPGGEVTVVQNFGRGPVIVLARSTRIALGRGQAMKVQVRKLAEKG